MSTDLSVTKKSALDRLNSAIEKESLDELVRAKTRRSLLVLDCSGSMGLPVRAGSAVFGDNAGERRIDALRKVVENVRAQIPVPMATFGPHGQNVELTEVVPEPGGMTPLHRAIRFGKEQGATHLVIVTDGEPDSEEYAFDAARDFGGPIDVFYVGDPSNARATKFTNELARRTGGQSGMSDLGQPKQLAGKIKGLLGDGKDTL
jgi:Mg-chelatase subunit ChlD